MAMAAAAGEDNAGAVGAAAGPVRRRRGAAPSGGRTVLRAKVGMNGFVAGRRLGSGKQSVRRASRTARPRRVEYDTRSEVLTVKSRPGDLRSRVSGRQQAGSGPGA